MAYEFIDWTFVGRSYSRCWTRNHPERYYHRIRIHPSYPRMRSWSSLWVGWRPRKRTGRDPSFKTSTIGSSSWEMGRSSRPSNWRSVLCIPARPVPCGPMRSMRWEVGPENWYHHTTADEDEPNARKRTLHRRTRTRTMLRFGQPPLTCHRRRM